MIRLIPMFLLVPLLIQCVEPPQYKPIPRTEVKSETDSTDKNAKKPDAATAGNTPTPQPTTPPTPPPTTPPTPPPTTPPVNTAGVVATGKTLLMQTCVNANCHSTATNTIDAKTAMALQTAGNLTVAAHQTNKLAFFTPPAAGAAANNFSHVLAYLMSIQTPVRGPNLP